MQLLNIQEASQLLGISKNTLYKYSSNGDIRKIKIGNRVLFSEEILKDFVKDHTINFFK